jgi:pimeloyl-ACP methyl ester carboxylesterase
MPADTVSTVLYLPGIAGHPCHSPMLEALQANGFKVIVPTIPGFDGVSGFQPPDDYIGWLTWIWDAVDACVQANGVVGPVHVIGASVGGMLAADLAVFRPELVASLTLINPFGIFDPAVGGFDVYAVQTAERLGHMFAKGVPDVFVTRFDERGDGEGKIGRYISDIAMASLLWPFGERGLGRRLYRITCPRLTLWGELDEIIPVEMAQHWGGAEVIVGAGHLAEWDAPADISARVLSFLQS